MRHNEVRDITADLLTEVCHGVGIEPPNPSQRSNFHSELRTWKMEHAWTLLLKNVWGKDRQCSFFDVSVQPTCPNVSEHITCTMLPKEQT